MSRSTDKQRRRKERKARQAKRTALKPAPVGYDADEPLPANWLTRPDEARLKQVLAYHRRTLPPGKRPPNEESHARLHVLVEDMNAAHEPAAVSRAMERLLADGLKRHDAVHAVAFLLTRHLDEEQRLPEEAREACEIELSQLTRARFEQLIGLR